MAVASADQDQVAQDGLGDGLHSGAVQGWAGIQECVMVGLAAMS
jgi:hypothetical protein